MSIVGMHEAKTRLSQLVQEVEAGGEVIITRRGREVARLVRVVPDRRRGLGAMRGVGSVTDASWEYIEAGDAEIAELFGLDDP